MCENMAVLNNECSQHDGVVCRVSAKLIVCVLVCE